MDISRAAEQIGREDVVPRLGFLEAEDVGRLLDEEALDDAEPRAHRIDVP